jgi:hypothetical protein
MPSPKPRAAGDATLSTGSMPEPGLKIHVCASFAVDVRAALSAHVQARVKVVELDADCVGFHGPCREAREGVHLPGAVRTELMVGDCSVSVSRAADGDDVCALHCCGPSGYPLINLEYAEQLVADGAYLLTPGWVRHWKSYLRAQGFDQTVARQYFREFASHLVLLDTGTDAQAAQRSASTRWEPISTCLRDGCRVASTICGCFSPVWCSTGD